MPCVINKDYYTKRDIKYFVADHLHNTSFEWEGIDGRKMKVFVKRNRSFIDRKMSQLMYKVYKAIEEETKEKVKKEKRNGRLFLNGKKVEIKSTSKNILAILDNEMVAERSWK